MAETNLIFSLLQIDSRKLSLVEKKLFELELFTRMSQELYQIYQCRYREYQKLLHGLHPQEVNFLNMNIIQEVVKDILSTEEYSVSGIAYYTHIPEEILVDIVVGKCTDLTFNLSRKLFELHISIRRNLYDHILKKILSDISFCHFYQKPTS